MIKLLISGGVVEKKRFQHSRKLQGRVERKLGRSDLKRDRKQKENSIFFIYLVKLGKKSVSFFNNILLKHKFVLYEICILTTK